MTTPLTHLTDPTNVLFELVPEAELGPGMTDDQAYAFLASIGPFGVKLPLTAAAEVHTGAMIALLPSEADAKRIALTGFEPTDQLHLTLVYLGDAVNFTDEQRAEIIDNVEAVVGAQITANAFAVSVFNPHGDEPALVLGVGNGGLELDELHANVMGVADDFDYAENHTPWVPHVTLAYSAAPLELMPDAIEKLGPITFDRVRVAFGGDNVDLPLSASVSAN